MGQPQMATTSNVDSGLGDSLVAYGYAMTGTSLPACAAPTIVTGTFYLSSPKRFVAAKYGTVTASYTPAPATAATILTLATIIAASGPTGLYTTTGTLSTYILTN